MRVHDCWKTTLHGLLLLLTVLPILSCSDRLPTSPVPAPEHDEVVPTSVLSVAVGMPPETRASYQLTLPAPSSGSLAWSSVPDVFPTGRALYLVTGSGALTGEWTRDCTGVNSCNPIPLYRTGGVLTATGACLGNVSVNGTTPPGCGADLGGYMLVADSVMVSRHAGPYYGDCGYNCIAWSGSHDVTLTRVPADLELEALSKAGGSAVSVVRWGNAAYFSARINPTSAGGKSLPFYPREWTWIADPTTVPVKTELGGIYGCNPQASACAPKLRESGSMEEGAYVNGKVIRKRVHVEVLRRRLALGAAPKLVRQGATVTFTASRDTAGGTATAPQWSVSDSAAIAQSTCKPGVWTCTETALKSYTRTVGSTVDDSAQSANAKIKVYTKFEVVADKLTPKLGDTVVFTALIDDQIDTIPRWVWNGQAVASCSNAPTCRQVMDTVGPGVMVGWTQQSGGDSAAAEVTTSALALRVNASPTSAKKGETVSFSFLVDGAPHVARRWTFVPDSAGGDAAACPAASLGCKKIMQMSGVMVAEGVVYRHVDSASVKVTVEGECPTAPFGLLVQEGWVGLPCGAVPNGDSTGSQPRPTRFSLTVHRTAGLVGPLVPWDTVGTFVFDSGTVLTADVSLAPGYRDLLVFVDDTLKSGLNGIPSYRTEFVMDRDRVLHFDASPDPFAAPFVRAYADRVSVLLEGSNAATATADYIAWMSRETEARGDAAIIDMRRATGERARLWDDRVKLATFADAIGGQQFALSAVDTGLQVAVLPPNGVSAASRASLSDTAVERLSVPSTTIYLVTGILNSLADTEGRGAELARLLKGNALREGETVVHIAAPSRFKTWSDTADARFALCAAQELSRARTMASVIVHVSMCRGLISAVGPVIKYSQLLLEGAEVAHQAWRVRRGDFSAKPDSVIARVRDRIAADRQRGTHGVWVAHSRGNLWFLDGLAAAVPSSSSLPSCTALLSLAAPISRSMVPLPSSRVRGFIVYFDPFWDSGMNSGFEAIDSEATRELELRIPFLRRTPDPSRLMDPTWWKFAALTSHDLTNYFSDPEGSPKVKTAVSELRAACESLQ